MKILWFANTPANGDEYLNTQLRGTGGWLKALDKELQRKVFQTLTDLGTCQIMSITEWGGLLDLVPMPG